MVCRKCGGRYIANFPEFVGVLFDSPQLCDACCAEWSAYRLRVSSTGLDDRVLLDFFCQGVHSGEVVHRHRADQCAS